MKKYKSLRGIIRPYVLVNMRLQGMSLAEIANQLDVEKPSLNRLLRKFKSQNFDGYMPIDVNQLKTELDSNLTFAQIAYKHNISPVGLRNYITDYNIENRLTEQRLREVASTASTKAAIADFFGVDVHTIYTLLKKYNIN